MRKALLAVLLMSSTALAGQHPVKVKKEIVLPAPEFVYKGKNMGQFEKQKESLQREKELLQMKVDIAKLRSELKKYEEFQPTVVQQRAVQGKQTNPQVELQKEYLRMRVQRQNLMMLEGKLSKLQNLFTGIMKLGNKKVAFDSFGRKYSIGSVVDGVQILDIQDDGVVVGLNGQIFKIPIASGIAEKKQNNQQQTETYQPPSPPPEETPEAPETPPPVQ